MSDITEPTVIPHPPEWLSVWAELLRAIGIERIDDLFAALPFLLGLFLFAHIIRAERKRSSGTKGDPS